MNCVRWFWPELTLSHTHICIYIDRHSDIFSLRESWRTTSSQLHNRGNRKVEETDNMQTANDSILMRTMKKALSSYIHSHSHAMCPWFIHCALHLVRMYYSYIDVVGSPIYLLVAKERFGTAKRLEDGSMAKAQFWQILVPEKFSCCSAAPDRCLLMSWDGDASAVTSLFVPVWPTLLTVAAVVSS